MKTIVVLTDDNKGGVDIQYMTEMTVDEAARGMRPQDSPGYRWALLFNTLGEKAKVMAACGAETEQEAARCWH